MITSATVAVRSFPGIFGDSFKPKLGNFEMARRGNGVPFPDESVDVLSFRAVTIFKFSASGATTVPLSDHFCMEVLLRCRYRLLGGK